MSIPIIFYMLSLTIYFFVLTYSQSDQSKYVAEISRMLLQTIAMLVFCLNSCDVYTLLYTINIKFL